MPAHRAAFAASRVAGWLAAGSIAAMIVAMVACAGSPDATAITEVFAPDYNQFKGAGAAANQAGVSRLLERHCGTLDCHGQVGRAMRIYGQYGLRYVDPTADVLNQPGLQPTTEVEFESNYQSVIGLQPEILSLVVQGADPPESLLLIRKPELLERHKGGAVFVSGDDSYQCITSWLGGQVDLNACGRATATQ
jgi:hypothetical protein